jgi:DNA-directed RNA polymerase subunit RPC12/RpoP
MEEKIRCVNCNSEIVLEQVTARGIFTREPNTENVEVGVISWEPRHDFYECFDCGCRWIKGEVK